MSRTSRGILAGSAGTTAISAATYLDMALRGRAASDTPAQVIGQLLDRSSFALPGDRQQRSTRQSALGALSGITTGIAIGAAAGWLRDHGYRLSRFGESVLIGGAAMVATDGSIVALGVSDPRGWTPSDWAADAVPHLVYGAVTRAALDATERTKAATAARVRRTRLRTLRRAGLIGVATGGRSTVGVAALALSRRRAQPETERSKLATGVAGALAVGELVADKLPSTPSRLEPPDFLPRLLLGVTTGASIGRRHGEYVGLPAVAGVLGSLAASHAGVWWREVGAPNLGVSPLIAALIEDAVVAGAAATAVAAGRGPVLIA